jgi:5-hydroxyisourate hydrolase
VIENDETTTTTRRRRRRAMAVISTHVLDLAKGRPASGMAVQLSGRGADADEWSMIADRVTDNDGRVKRLAEDARPGVYRLWFDVGSYLGPDGFFPEVSVAFRIDDGGRDIHVPLLLNQYGYSTYRGS